MEKKYTKGKWIPTQSRGLSLQVCLDDEDHTIVAHVETCNPVDAHLNAAAPGLLDALEAFEAYDKVNCDAEMYGSFEDSDEKEYLAKARFAEGLHAIAQTKARAAIRKAYGEDV